MLGDHAVVPRADLAVRGPRARAFHHGRLQIAACPPAALLPRWRGGRRGASPARVRAHLRRQLAGGLPRQSPRRRGVVAGPVVYPGPYPVDVGVVAHVQIVRGVVLVEGDNHGREPIIHRGAVVRRQRAGRPRLGRGGARGRDLVEGGVLPDVEVVGAVGLVVALHDSVHPPVGTRLVAALHASAQQRPELAARGPPGHGRVVARGRRRRAPKGLRLVPIRLLHLLLHLDQLFLQLGLLLQHLGLLRLLPVQGIPEVRPLGLHVLELGGFPLVERLQPGPGGLGEGREVGHRGASRRLRADGRLLGARLLGPGATGRLLGRALLRPRSPLRGRARRAARLRGDGRRGALAVRGGGWGRRPACDRALCPAVQPRHTAGVLRRDALRLVWLHHLLAEAPRLLREARHGAAKVPETEKALVGARVPEVHLAVQQQIVIQVPSLVQERVLAAEYDHVHRHPSGPHVDGEAVAAAALRQVVLLGRHERWSATLLLQQLAFGQVDGQAEVGELEHARLRICRHHEVVRLDVAVADALRVEGTDGGTRLPHPLRHLLLLGCKAPLANLVAKVAPVAVLQSEVDAAVVLERVEQLRDVLVRARLHHAYLPLDVLARHAPPGEGRFVELLDGNRVALVPVDGAPYRAKGALAELNLLKEVALLELRSDACLALAHGVGERALQARAPRGISPPHPRAASGRRRA
mmetsp:Transcript_42086/g.120789  ORF Transcript_42086/g.120789 Transcript_42086/m.120789 type:complete len:695 (+) Transcript_42086:307-2391(+)